MAQLAERCAWDAEVARSNRVTPTKIAAITAQNKPQGLTLRLVLHLCGGKIMGEFNYAADTFNGCFVCFIGQCDHEVFIDEIIKRSEATYTNLVFFDGNDCKSLTNIISSHNFPSPVDISIINNVSENTIASLRELKSKKIIRNIYISALGVYYILPHQDVYYGVERWDYMGTPEPLMILDCSVQTCTQIHVLIKTVESIVQSILQFKPKNDIEKILMTDIWFQRYIQYVKDRKSPACGGMYICDEIQRQSQADDVFRNHYGRCEDIAFSVSLVLNHPQINVDCRQVTASRNDGFNHSWNIVCCDGKEYYLDVTHNITCSPNRIPGSLKSNSYNTQFTLLGINESKVKYGVTKEYEHKNISVSSYDRDKINTILEDMVNRNMTQLTWDEPLVTKSRFISNSTIT